MTKQEKIKENTAEDLWNICATVVNHVNWTELGEDRKQYFRGKANSFLLHLHSQDAVVKVDRELPRKSDVRVYGSNNLDYEAGYGDGFSRCRNEVKTYFVATVPLIQEVENGKTN